jgi:hypothetical protein
MSILHGVSYIGLDGMISMLRWADHQMRQTGARHYIGVTLPAGSNTWYDKPQSSPTAEPKADRASRPPRWLSFTDFADELRTVDAACRKHGCVVHIKVMFPFPSGRRGTRRYRTAQRMWSR